MTDIEAKALVLVNEICLEKGVIPYAKLPNIEASEALCRAIEQHEAFRQEVSDAVEEAFGDGVHPSIEEPLVRFIIPAPKPDPLVRVINEVIYAQPHGDIDEIRMADDFRAALEARGLEIREKNDD